MQVKLFLQIFLLLIPVFLFGSQNTLAQTWQSLNGPLESDIRDIVIKNDTIYVVSWPNGFFKKEVNSDQWLYSEIVEGVGAFRQGIEGALSFQVDIEGRYYVGGNGFISFGDNQTYSHFYTSTDYGKTWNEFRSGIEFSGTVADIELLPSKDMLISGAGGIFKLSNQTDSFANVAPSFVSYSLFEKEDTLWSGNYDGAKYSVDMGDSWVPNGPDSLRIFSMTNQQDKYFFGSNQGLYTSTGIEEEWSLVSNVDSTSILSLFTYNNQILIGTNIGIFVLDQSLTNAQPIFPELTPQKIRVINAHNNELFLGTNKGLYRCSLENSSCELDGVPNSTIQSLATQNDTLLVNSLREVYRYFTTEERWDTTSISVDLRRVIPHLKDSIYAIETRLFYKCSFATQQCTDTQVTEPSEALLDIVATTSKIFTFSTQRVYQSNNKGDSWISILEDSPRTFYGLSTFADSLLFVSGATSLKYSIETQSSDTLSKPVSLVTENGTLYSAAGGIHKSTDFGETWIEILSPSDYLPDGIIREILFDENSEKLYVLTTVGRVYLTENGGLDWGVNEEMYPIYIESAEIGTNGIIYLGTGKAGLFANTHPLNPPITIDNELEATQIPNNFKLLASYPNPFNPTTTISFELNSAKKITLNVFNILGQQVTNYDLGLRQAGVQNFKLDLSDQASGVYIIRIQSGSEIRSGKITLIK
ncbi:MAG: T9SS type A sorting domain-containing protein [Balneola sp.]